MMKVYLLAAERPDGRRWRAALDPSFRADAAHGGGRSARLWRSLDPLPLGRALAAADVLNGRNGQARRTVAGSGRRAGGFAGRWKRRSWRIDGLAGGWKWPARRIGGQNGRSGRPAGRTGVWRERDEPFLVPVVQTAPADSEAQAAPAGSDALDRLAAAMEGRSLLAEEFDSLVRSLGIAKEDGEWRYWAQLGLLYGLFELRTGVAVFRPFGRFGRERAVCRRCGADERWIRRTPCASCGERCPYCERCLAMGRARACTPLFVGPARRRPDRHAERLERSGSPAQTARAPDRPVWPERGPDMPGRTAYGPMPARRPARQPERPEQPDRAQPDGQARRSALGSGVQTDLCGPSAADAEQAAMAAVFGLSLSPAQEAAARAGVRFVLAGRPGAPGAGIRPFLIWAVTGAGKTEMMFPLIAAERARGGRVAVATPRRDVVLELAPRIAAAFPDEETAALYGGSGRRWPAGGILVATCHQLLRFEAAFDLVVLDEVDAFPYHGDPMLAFAARKACRPGAAFVMLTATPPPALQRAVRRGRLACAKVPVRYHRHPLPVPSVARPAKLAALLAETVRRGAQAFVFVPRISRLEPELARLRRELAGVLPPGRMDAASSRDPLREEKVRRLRSGDIRILLATTILERGVTIPRADVYVLDADHRLFDAAALVQMAGRAGRSAEDPAGRVVFLSRRRTREMRRAIRQIRDMNRLAERLGWLAKPAASAKRRAGGRGRAPCRE